MIKKHFKKTNFFKLENLIGKILIYKLLVIRKKNK